MVNNTALLLRKNETLSSSFNSSQNGNFSVALQDQCPGSKSSKKGGFVSIIYSLNN